MNTAVEPANLMAETARIIRWLCWALIVLAIASAILAATTSLNPFGTDLVGVATGVGVPVWGFLLARAMRDPVAPASIESAGA